MTVARQWHNHSGTQQNKNEYQNSRDLINWVMLSRIVRPTAARRFARPASTISDSLSKAKAAYESNKAKVDGPMGDALKSSKVVLFMEGTVDHPQSELSLNVVKMLTEAQAVPYIFFRLVFHDK